MAGERKGPRQPLSRVRPGAARPGKGKGQGLAGPPGNKGVGGPPRGEKSAKKPRAASSKSLAPAKKRTAKSAAGGPPPISSLPHADGSTASKSRRTSRPVSGAPKAPSRPPADPAEVYRRLHETYPDAHCALDHTNAYQLLVATILSAQCTDARVNMVTPALFTRFPNAQALSGAEPAELENMIRSTGFFRSKTKSLIGMATAVVDRHGGEIPDEMDALTKLPGVGRKTANVILGNAFGKNEGVVVDTHVTRLSNRLGLTMEQDPVKIEQDLIRQFPRDDWTLLSHLLIDHGRAICIARAPKCPICPLADICPSALV